MKGYLLSFLKKHTSIYNISFLLLVNVIMVFLVLPEASVGVLLGSGHNKTIDRYFFFSNADFYQALSDYGEQGRSYFSFLLLTADLIFPFLYVALMVFIGYRLYGIFKPKWRNKWVLFPLIFIVFEIVENSSLLLLIGQFPIEHSFYTTFLGFFVMCKWLLVASFSLFLVLMLLSLAREEARHRFFKQ